MAEGILHIYNNGAWKDATPYVYNNGVWKPAKAYIYRDDSSSGQPEISMPSGPMTSNTSLGCTVTASSRYSTTYPEWHVFDDNKSSCWCSQATAKAPHWVKLLFSEPLASATVKVYAREHTDSKLIHPPTELDITYGIDAKGEEKGYTTSTLEAVGSGELIYTFNVFKTQGPIDYIKISVNTWSNSGDNTNYCAIGEIEITGVPQSAGPWKLAK